ncbi:uncharacterized protein LOC128220644 isoform X1 [Mya arenaria]|uniref:uncharacterized protein LOC128220644 isoform X1 n=1 Tax=Mya arenaria TaxID=6604 RepID=UPI0022E6449E|nr:uncharacterized protein LOC128220644 isoform X1 [Mya arenaria]
MSDNKNYNRLIKMFVKVGKVVLVQLIERYVSIRGREWTVDHLIHENIARITATTTGHKNIMIFFPGLNQRTDLAAWSMHMLCFVLREICVDLPDSVSHSIDELRGIRDTICFGEAAMSDHSFEQMVSSIRRIFSSLSEYSGENAQVDEELRAPLTKPDEQVCFTEVVAWHTDEKEHRERVREVPDELKMITDRIVSLRKANKAVPPREEAMLELPVLKIVLQPKAKTLRQSLDVSKRLATAFLGVQSTSLDDLEREVKRVIETLKSENLQLSNVKRGCIELHIQCSNIESFTKLIEDCVSGKLTNMFEPVQQAIRQQEGFEEYTQELFMYKDDFDSCMIELANNIDNYLTDNEMTLFASSHRQINIDKNLSSHCGEITLTVKCNKSEDLQKFEQFNKDGRLYKTFERLSTVLNRSYKTEDIYLEVAMEQLPLVREQVEPEPHVTQEQIELGITSVADDLTKSGLLLQRYKTW